MGYPYPEDLTPEEWFSFISLVDRFAKAKESRNYKESDALREELRQWQDHTSDEFFVEMYRTGRYQWHPLFEQQGEGSHRHLRLGARASF